MGVEQPRSHQSKRVNGRFLPERPGRPQQPAVTVVYGGIFWKRISWMKIERHVQPFDLCPKRQISLEVIVDAGVAVGDLAEAVHERAAEPQFAHTPFELAGREVRGLHLQ